MLDNCDYIAIRISDTSIGRGYSHSTIEYLTFDEQNDCWYMTNNQDDVWFFDSKAEAEQEILNFGDEYLTVIAIAQYPKSEKAIASIEALKADIRSFCGEDWPLSIASIESSQRLIDELLKK